MVIKKQLANYFLADSRDYLLRYKKLEECATHIGLRTKLVVELMFSLECALKSLFIIETDLEEKQAYKKVKILSHDIEKIVQNLTVYSQAVFNSKVTINIENYKVFHRYIFEGEMAFREEFGNHGLKYYETINNHSWRQSLYNQIREFVKYVDSKNPIEFNIESLSDINIEEEMSNFKKLKDILAK